MDLDISINYTFSSNIIDPDYTDENSFTKDIFFDILLNDEFGQTLSKIGSGHLQLIDLERHNELYMSEETSVYFCEIADSSHEFLELFKALFLEETVANGGSADFSDFTKSVSRILKRSYFNSSFINLSRLEIIEDYQNKKIGSSVVKQLKKEFSYFGDFISTKPYPLQFEGKFDEEDFSEEEYDLKQKKVNSFYIKNGFKKVGKSRIYICPI
jgi:hypothetical protein